ncbi:hypothetical protein D8674_037996 [Pyrus ussuriensis x Pyrus communis]|uniref:Uncharacterized protein n=1 Tax=Pyrus ussuriensis x Pyrus communis TaxID=2448454 RepID=A0A5N5FNI0_9ROSA|nr:hypothetical protein D8674_037996 [Pyrus ussuriensis x Pyrus communis]
MAYHANSIPRKMPASWENGLEQSSYQVALLMWRVVSMFILPGNSQSEDVRRRSSMEDLDHIWHPNSFGTHFMNDLLMLTINGLSLAKVWCDQKRIPPWAFLNAKGLTHT